MKQIKYKSRQGDILLASIGLVSIVLSIFNYNISLLTLEDICENTMRWNIRILLILVVGVLFFLKIQITNRVHELCF